MFAQMSSWTTRQFTWPTRKGKRLWLGWAVGAALAGLTLLAGPPTGAADPPRPPVATRPTTLPQTVKPANPDLIPEARNVLAFLQSIQGQKTLAGISNSGGWRSFYEWSGRAPAVYAEDCNNQRRPKFGPEYNACLLYTSPSPRD